MTNENEETLATRVANQQARVENYRRILKEYQSGRWYDLYRRNLRELEDELANLEAQLAAENGAE